MYNLFGHASFVGSADVNEYNNKILDHQGHYTRTPSAEEYAKSQGIAFDSEEADKSKLGQIGTLSDLEDDDDNMDANGSFLWSF